MPKRSRSQPYQYGRRRASENYIMNKIYEQGMALWMQIKANYQQLLPKEKNIKNMRKSPICGVPNNNRIYKRFFNSIFTLVSVDGFLAMGGDHRTNTNIPGTKGRNSMGCDTLMITLASFLMGDRWNFATLLVLRVHPIYFF